MHRDPEQVLVTGAGGFIGSHLVEALAESGVRVRALVHYNSRNHWGWLEQLPERLRPRVEVLPGDVSDYPFVRSAADRCKVVYHLAALIGIPYSYVATHSYLKTNVEGTLHVLQACREARVERVVHTSTSEVYGTAQFVPITEEHPLQGQSPYAATKIAADKLAESFYRSFDLPVVTVRPFNTYGPRQSARAVIPTIITQALLGETISMGSLATVRDFNYVRDTVHGFMLAGTTPGVVGLEINLGTGIGVTISDVVARVEQIVGHKLNVVVEEQRIRPEKSEVMQLIAGTERAERTLGWKAKYTFAQGVKETVDWMRENLSGYKAQFYSI